MSRIQSDDAIIHFLLISHSSRLGCYIKRRKRGYSQSWKSFVFLHLSVAALLRLQFGAHPLPFFFGMLCWGKAKDGQLGVGVERNPMFEPRNCNVFSGRGLKEAVCGGQHSVFLLHDGSVYTCGSNSCGQLGHNKPGTSPGMLLFWNCSVCVCVLLYLSHYSWYQTWYRNINTVR